MLEAGGRMLEAHLILIRDLSLIYKNLTNASRLLLPASCSTPQASGLMHQHSNDYVSAIPKRRMIIIAQ